jgi:hypothetical protein
MKQTEFHDIPVTPFVDPFRPGVTGGPAFPADSPDFVCNQRGTQTFRATAAPAAPGLPRMAGSYVYGGFYSTHFGHFIAESTHRLWALRQVGMAGLPVVFVGSGRQAPVPPWIRQFLDILFGVRDIVIVDRPQIIERLIVPEPGKILGAAHQPWYAQTIRDHAPAGRLAAAAAAAQHPRLFVSRAHLNTGRLIGESIIEQALHDAGYLIMRPERLTIEEQFGLYLGAESIVLSEGSAIHLLEHLPALKARIAVLCRRRSGARLAKHSLGGLGHDIVIHQDILPLPPMRGDPMHRALGVADPGAVLAFLAHHGMVGAAPASSGDMASRLAADLLGILEARLAGREPGLVGREFARMLAGATAPDAPRAPAAMVELGRRMLDHTPDPT